MRERYAIAPSAQVYYQREAYEGLVESDVRVTFDSLVTALHPGERPSRAMLYHPSRSLLPDTLTILEVKATRSIPGSRAIGGLWPNPSPSKKLGLQIPKRFE